MCVGYSNTWVHIKIPILEDLGFEIILHFLPRLPFWRHIACLNQSLFKGFTWIVVDAAMIDPFNFVRWANVLVSAMRPARIE